MIIGCLAASTAAPAAAGEAVEVTPLLTTRQTASGQPILLPQRDVQVVVSRFVIQPGTTLPVHLHPWQRYGYLLSGELEVTLADNGRVIRYSPGDFIVEAREQWHSGAAVGTEPAVLIIIDQVEAGHSNTVLKPAAHDTSGRE